MFMRIGLLALIAVGIAGSYQQTKPMVIPFLSEVDGSGFVVDCLRRADEPPGPPKLDIRVDGAIQPQPTRGSTGGVAPGQAWRALVTIHQESPASGAGLGFQIHRQIVIRLTTGSHTISFRCGPEWSPDVAFYFKAK